MKYSSSHHASLFGYIAREVYHNYPDGEKIMAEAVKRYGHERGARQAERAKKDGLPLDMTTYMMYREIPPEEEEGRFVPFGSELMPNGDFHAMTGICPWSSKWMELNLCKECGVYCRYVDHALAAGFSENCIVDCTANLTDGAEHCDLWFRGANLKDPETGKKRALYGPKLARANVKKGWDYHLAHTYWSLERTLKDYLPADEVAKIMKKAVESFEEEYGEHSADDFMKLTSQDFTSVDDYVGIAGI